MADDRLIPFMYRHGQIPGIISEYMDKTGPLGEYVNMSPASRLEVEVKAPPGSRLFDKEYLNTLLAAAREWQNTGDGYMQVQPNSRVSTLPHEAVHHIMDRSGTRNAGQQLLDAFGRMPVEGPRTLLDALLDKIRYVPPRNKETPAQKLDEGVAYMLTSDPGIDSNKKEADRMLNFLKGFMDPSDYNTLSKIVAAYRQRRSTQ